MIKIDFIKIIIKIKKNKKNSLIKHKKYKTEDVRSSLKKLKFLSFNKN